MMNYVNLLLIRLLKWSKWSMKKYVLLLLLSSSINAGLSSVRQSLAKIGQAAKQNFSKTAPSMRNFFRYEKTPTGHVKAVLDKDKRYCDLSFAFVKDSETGKDIMYKNPEYINHGKYGHEIKPLWRTDSVLGLQLENIQEPIDRIAVNNLNKSYSSDAPNKKIKCISKADKEYFKVRSYIQKDLVNKGFFPDIVYDAGLGDYRFQNACAYASGEIVFGAYYYEIITQLVRNEENKITTDIELENGIKIPHRFGEYFIKSIRDHEVGHLLLRHNEKILYVDSFDEKQAMARQHEKEADAYSHLQSWENCCGAIVHYILNNLNLKRRFLVNKKLRKKVLDFLDQIKKDPGATYKDLYYKIHGIKGVHPSHQERLEAAVEALYEHCKDKPEELAKHKKEIQDWANSIGYTYPIFK